ncbi:MAG: hypothetical protein ACJASX_001765 [Limisphaerales bacterium]|jgi:hypothetical protein
MERMTDQEPKTESVEPAEQAGGADKYATPRRIRELGRRGMFLGIVVCFFLAAHSMFFPAVVQGKTQLYILLVVAPIFLIALLLSMGASFVLRKAPREPGGRRRSRRDRRNSDSTLLTWQRR